MASHPGGQTECRVDTFRLPSGRSDRKKKKKTVGSPADRVECEKTNRINLAVEDQVT